MPKEISVVGNKKISTLKQQFNDKFEHLLLAVFPLSEKEKQTKAPYDSNKTISEVRTIINPGNISIHGLTKVSNLENEFEEIFGLYAQVCYIKADGGRFFTSGKYDEMSLAELNRFGEEQSWKKGTWS